MSVLTVGEQCETFIDRTMRGVPVDYDLTADHGRVLLEIYETDGGIGFGDIDEIAP